MSWWEAPADNECKSNPCLNNGTCTDRANGFNYSCPPKFVGKRCEQGGKQNWKIGFKSDGQEISTIEWQVLKNRFPLLFVHK